MTDLNQTQEEPINTEQQEPQQLKNSILKICEPMCINLIKEKPKNIASYMINWLQNKYNYSSSLLRNDEKKELQKLKDDIEIFHDMDEHFYFVEQLNKIKKDTKSTEKKGKLPPKPKPRLPPDEFIPSDDEDYENPDEIDPRLEDQNFLEANIRMEPRQGTFEYFTEDYHSIKYKAHEKSHDLSEFIRINLMKSPLFSELSLDILKKCIDAMEEKHYNAMSEVVKQDDFSDYFYFIAEGELECRMGFTKITREGNRKKVEKFEPRLVKIYYPGDYFGELNLLYHMPIRATVKAISETKIYILNRNIYKQILNKSFKDKNTKRIQLFKNTPILQTLTDEEFERLVQISKEAIYYKDEAIIKENEYCNNLMIIEEGNCIGTKINEEGKKALKIKDYREGCYFGEEALLKPEKRTESIIADSDVVRFICIDRYTFKNVFGSLEPILMRNMELYVKYFPPLPEIVEEVKPIIKPEDDPNNKPDNPNNINQENNNINDINNINVPGNQNEQIEIDQNNINNENQQTIEEITQKFNKEKETMKELYEKNIKMLNDKINLLEDQLKNINDNNQRNNVNNDNNNDNVLNEVNDNNINMDNKLDSINDMNNNMNNDNVNNMNNDMNNNININNNMNMDDNNKNDYINNNANVNNNLNMLNDMIVSDSNNNNLNNNIISNNDEYLSNNNLLNSNMSNTYNNNLNNMINNNNNNDNDGNNINNNNYLTYDQRNLINQSNNEYLSNTNNNNNNNNNINFSNNNTDVNNNNVNNSNNKHDDLLPSYNPYLEDGQRNLTDNNQIREDLEMGGDEIVDGDNNNDNEDNETGKIEIDQNFTQ